MGAHEHGTTGRVLHWARSYDALVWALTLGNERRFRQRLAELARLEAGLHARVRHLPHRHRGRRAQRPPVLRHGAVLDVGCGTGALAIAAKSFVGAGGQVAGVDPSPEMVARATRKAAKAGVEARFDVGTIESLPFPDATFDTVLSSLMLHHLTPDGRQKGIDEVARVLRRGGRFLAVDIGGTGGMKHGPFLRMGNHADFDLASLAPALEAAGLGIVDRGEVGQKLVRGLSNLCFILAETA